MHEQSQASRRRVAASYLGLLLPSRFANIASSVCFMILIRLKPPNCFKTLKSAGFIFQFKIIKDIDICVVCPWYFAVSFQISKYCQFFRKYIRLFYREDQPFEVVNWYFQKYVTNNLVNLSRLPHYPHIALRSFLHHYHYPRLLATKIISTSCSLTDRHQVALFDASFFSYCVSLQCWGGILLYLRLF